MDAHAYEMVLLFSREIRLQNDAKNKLICEIAVA